MSREQEKNWISDLWNRNDPARQGLDLKPVFTDNRTEDREGEMKRIYKNQNKNYLTKAM